MFKFTFLPQKKISNYILDFNNYISSLINFFSLKNLILKAKLLINDKRIIITTLIIIFSIFAHLSTPAFYKDDWVKKKIIKQFENRFSLKIRFSDKFYYSIFPVPNFVFNDVIIFSEENQKLIEIKKLTTNLSYKKFFDKNKMNIQNIKIEKANFNLKNQDLINFKNFFNTRINKNIVYIEDSKVFFINKDDEVFSIMSLTNGKKYYDDLNFENILSFKGDIFNTQIKFILNNKLNSKTATFNLDLPDLDIELNNKMSFLNSKVSGNLDYNFRNKIYSTNYEFDKKYLEFKSEDKIDEKTHSYKGNIRFNPFSSLFEINLDTIDLFNFFSNEGIFVKILRSNLFLNENFYSKLILTSKNSSSHRKIKNFLLKTNFENKKINFNGSTFDFTDIFTINLIDSIFENKINEKYFEGEIVIDIKNSRSLFQLFQTKKNLRQDIKKINFNIKYDYLQKTFQIKNIKVDGKENEKFRIIANQFNAEEKQMFKRIDFKNYFNYLMSSL